MTKKKNLNFIEAISVICGQEGCELKGVNGLTLDIKCPEGKEQELKCAKAVQRFIEDARPDVEVFDGPEDGDGCGGGCCEGTDPSCNCGGECKH